MWAPASRRIRFVLAAATLLCGPASCDFLGLDDDAQPIPEDQDPPDHVENCDFFGCWTALTGRIHAVFDSAPTLGSTAVASGRSDTSSSVTLPPDSAFAGLPGDDGRIGRFAVGPASGDSYFIPRVDAGERRLVVSIIDAENTPIGGVLVLDETRAVDSIVTEPVTGETTLERALYVGLILGHLRIPVGHVNPPQVALVTRFSEDVAGRAAVQRGEIRSLVDAYERAQRGFVRGFIEMTPVYDSLAVNGALLGPAQAYARARNQGTDAATAHDAFVEGAVNAYIEWAGTPAQVATAWGAFATLHDAELAGRTTLTRLQSAQNLLHISITARQELVATVPDGRAGKAEVSAALDDILAAGMGAADMSGFVDAVAAAVSDGADALTAARGSDISAGIEAADLAAFVDPTMSPEEVALAIPDYLSGVESAAGDDDLAPLLIALMGGPGYGSPGP